MFDTTATYLVEIDGGRRLAFPHKPLRGRTLHDPETYRDALLAFEAFSGQKATHVGRPRTDGGPSHMFEKEHLLRICAERARRTS